MKKQDVYKILEFEKKGNRDCNKKYGKETSNQLEPVTDKKLLPMHHSVLASVIIQNFQMHVQIKHSLGNLQHLIPILTGVFYTRKSRD